MCLMWLLGGSKRRKETVGEGGCGCRGEGAETQRNGIGRDWACAGREAGKMSLPCGDMVM